MDKSYPVVLEVKWFDATSTDDWTDVKEIIQECHLIRSVGILVTESKDMITLTLNHDMSGDSMSQFIHIPTAWIKERSELCVKKIKRQKKK